MDRRLVNGNFSMGGLDANMDTIMKKFAKMDWLYPESDSIKVMEEKYNYHGNAEIPVEYDSASASVTKSASTTDYTITITGTVKKLSTDAKTALFGASASQTNACVLLIEVPLDYRKLTYKRGSTDVTLEAGDTIEIDNRTYLVVVLGLYNNSGTVTCATETFEIGCNCNTVKYALTVSGATLEV